MTKKPSSRQSSSPPNTFEERVRSLICTDKSDRAFARRAGIPPSSLRNILSGKSPTLDNLVAVARAGGVSIDWLVNGKSDPHPQDDIDNKLLGLVLEGIKLVYEKERAQLDDRSAGELSGRIYKETLIKCDYSDNRDLQLAALNLVLLQLQHDLHSTDPVVLNKLRA